MNRESHKGKASCDTREDTLRNVEYYISYMVTTFGYARMWPAELLQSNRCKILLSSVATFVFILLNIILVFSEIVMMLMSSDLTLFAKILGAIGLHLTGAIKWCYCIYNNREIFSIVMTLDRCHILCHRIDDSEEACRLYNDTMEQACRFCNYFICSWMSVTIYGVLHWCSNPLLVTSRENKMDSINNTLNQRGLPFITWQLWNIDNIYSYICLYFTQIIGGVACAIGTVCYDAFYVSLVMVICMQLQYVNTVLTKIDSNKVPQAMFNLEKKLTNCMLYHVEIIKFLEMLQNFTGPAMFMQCIETLFIICLVSFEVTTIKFTVTDRENVFRLWSLFEYFLCAAVELYFFCHLASQLQYLGLQLAQSVYSCGWELTLFERKKQLNSNNKYYDINRLVLMITEQAQKPLILTGGPFYMLSLETFRVIISMAISNSVMLRTISDSDK